VLLVSWTVATALVTNKRKTIGLVPVRTKLNEHLGERERNDGHIDRKTKKRS